MKAGLVSVKVIAAASPLSSRYFAGVWANGDGLAFFILVADTAI